MGFFLIKVFNMGILIATFSNVMKVQIFAVENYGITPLLKSHYSAVRLRRILVS